MSDRAVISRVSAAIVSVVGLVVLAGWWLDMPTLTSLHPSLVSMKANTALALVLAGAALVVLADTPLSPRRVRLGRWLALLVVMIGALTLCEYFFGWQLGIDELLFKDAPTAVATPIPGRMAPSTALCFVLLGLALVGIEWEPRQGFRPAELLALAGGVVSLISLAEYAAGKPILYNFSAYTRMALHTAAALFVLFAGVLLARPALGVVGTMRSGRVSRLELRAYSAMAVALLAVLVGGAVFYRAQEERMRQEVEAQLKVIAHLKVEQINQWRTERFGDATVLAASSIFADAVRRWMADPQAERTAGILSRFRAMQRYNQYSDIWLVDDRTHVRLSLSGSNVLDAEEVLLLAAVRQAKQPMLSDLHTGSGTRPPHLDLIAPLFAGAGAKRQFIGAVALRLDARQFLYPLIRSWPTASLSAENLLVRRDGNDVLFLNDLRHRPDAAFRLRIPLSRREVPAVAAVLGREGVFHGMDYRGVPALSVLSRIPNTSWFVVSKVDEAEAMAEWRFRARLIVVVILSMMLALAAGAGAFWQQRRRYRALHRSAEALQKSNRAYRVLSKCNESLVRATDEAQLLQSICDLLVEHGGYRFAWVGFAELDEARSVRPVAKAGLEEGYLEEVHITWADTERGRGPTGTAIRTGNVCVARDVATDPTCAPWHDAALARGYASALVLPLPFNGDIGGALCIYHSEVNAFDPEETRLLAELAADLAYGIRALRDRAAHRQAEEALQASEEGFRLLVDGVKNHSIHRLDPKGRVVTWNTGAQRLKGYVAAEILGKHFSCFYGPQAIAAGEPDDALALAASAGSCQQEGWRLRKDGSRFWAETTMSALRNARGELVGFAKLTHDISERRRHEEALELERSKLIAAFENVDVGVVTCDARGGGIFMNSAALNFHGFASTEDMLDRIDDYAADWECSYSDGRVMSYDEWPLMRAIRGDYVRDYDTHLRNIKTGHTWACSYSSAPVRNNAGEF